MSGVENLNAALDALDLDQQRSAMSILLGYVWCSVDAETQEAAMTAMRRVVRPRGGVDVSEHTAEKDAHGIDLRYCSASWGSARCGLRYDHAGLHHDGVLGTRWPRVLPPAVEHDEWCDANGCRCGKCPCLGPPSCVLPSGNPAP